MRHMHAIDRALCALASSADQIGEATRSIFGDVDCPDCLRRAITEGEERNRVLRDLLAKVEVSAPQRCRIYDTACINPSYCDAHDACCAGDMNCKPSAKPEETP